MHGLPTLARLNRQAESQQLAKRRRLLHEELQRQSLPAGDDTPRSRDTQRRYDRKIAGLDDIFWPEN